MTKRICSGKTRPAQSTSLSFLVLLFLSVPISSQADSFTDKVVGVSDGDTIKVMRMGRAVKVRLHGIDYPEKGQPFGTRAKQFTSDQAFGKHVEVRVRDTDRYGSLVAEVMLPSSKNLNHELVYARFAWWYRKYAPNDKTLKALEAGTKAAKGGLWGDKKGGEKIWAREKRGLF